MSARRWGTTEHDELAAALHKMLAAEAEPWPELIRMGLGSIGADGSTRDLVVVCEELGHHAVPGPVPESLAVAPTLLGPREGVTTLAMPPQVPFAADVELADLVLLITEGQVHRGQPGARYESVDPSRSLHAVSAAQVLRHDVPAETFDLGVLANCAYLHGCGRALLEMSVDYARVREQFGGPIGANQAVQHRLADVAIGLEFAAPLLEAAESLTARDVSAAKVACADAAYRCARAALQVHGAIGYTAEHGVSRYLLKIRALMDAWGTRSWHRARIMESLCAQN